LGTRETNFAKRKDEARSSGQPRSQGALVDGGIFFHFDFSVSRFQLSAFAFTGGLGLQALQRVQFTPNFLARALLIDVRHWNFSLRISA
jgi:hypothetical protein